MQKVQPKSCSDGVRLLLVVMVLKNVLHSAVGFDGFRYGFDTSKILGIMPPKH
jgi:hypothetical protein